MRAFRIGFGLWASTLPLMAAYGEAADQAPAAPVETVVVTGHKPSVQVLPDRVVYTLDKNLQSMTGSISDVLRDLPSVDVDILGNVSIRGETNVTILVDGKKSPLLAGSLADALQQIPADMVESIEVITNPSAEFKAEGTGGIINIVLKKNRQMASSGLVRLSVGDKGRVGASVSGNYKLGRVLLHATYGERRDARDSTASVQRSDTTVLRSIQATSAKSANAGRFAALSANIDATEHDTVTLGGSYNGHNGKNNSFEHNISLINATDTVREGLSHWVREGAGVSVGYRHKFDTKDETLDIDVTHFSAWGQSASNYTSADTATDTPYYWQSRQSVTREDHTEFKTGYVLPLAGDAQNAGDERNANAERNAGNARNKDKFKIGYSLDNDTNQTDNRGFLRQSATGDWTDDSAFLNFFVLERTIHAGYVSYEQHFGPFAVMGGLRVEQDFLSTDLRTTGERHDTSTFGLYPSLHLSYALSDTQMVRLSYSRRMNRPGASALNPARYSSDAFNVRSGNPLLKPEQTDSFETSYRYMGESFDAVATGFYRATYKGITSVYRYLSDSVLLTTQDNLARRMASGFESNLTFRLPSGVTLKSSGMLAYSEFDPGASGAGQKQSGMNFTVKGGVEWQISPRDRMQINANYSGKQRFAQGYRQPTLNGDFAYRHNLGDGFSGVFTLNNLFHSWNRNSVLDSADLHQIDRRAVKGRVFYLGLTYAFGKSRETEPENDEGETAYQGGL